MGQEEDIASTRDWLIIPRVSRTVPFGYYPDPEDVDLLLPDVRELEALEKAKKHLKNGYSYRDTAAWLLEVTGRSISHMGLKKRVEDDKTKRDRLAGLKLQAARIEEQIRKIEKARRIANGGEDPTDDGDHPAPDRDSQGRYC